MSSPGYSSAQVYIVCTCGAGKNKIAVSHWFDYYPGETIRDLRARYRAWLIGEIQQSRLDYKLPQNGSCDDPAKWRCYVAPGVR